MRSFLTVLAMIVGFKAFAFSDGLNTTPPSRIDTSNLIQDDRFVPFPWSTQQPIRTETMEGFWLVKNGNFTSYFSFRVDSKDDRYFEVKQIDVMTCRSVAVGMGAISRSGKTFTANLDYVKFNRSYKMMVRAYNHIENKAKGMELNPINGHVLIVSILAENKSSYVHMPLSKVKAETAPYPCRVKK